MRLRLSKIGGRIVLSVRRVVAHLAENHPSKDDWLRLACGLA